MNTQTLLPILAAGAVIVALGLIIWLASRIILSLRLKRKFGAEYDYTMEKTGNRRSAETDLKEREKRLMGLDIHPLSEHEKERYHQEWTETQAYFVDNPAQSVEKANRLITEVMIARGFPVSNYEQRSADLSVLYPNIVLKYREANAIAENSKAGKATTENLRQAMLDYHSLFDQLLETAHPVEAVNEQEQEQEKEKQAEAA